MSSPLATMPTIPAITPAMLDKVTRLEELMLKEPQIALKTEHIIHGGMYARTVRIGPGVLFTGGMVKRPTMLIIHGEADVLVGAGTASISGYNVAPGSAGRKQVFFTRGPIELTMIVPTSARTVEEAEAELTDDAERLLSRTQDNGDTVTITGE